MNELKLITIGLLIGLFCSLPFLGIPVQSPGDNDMAYGQQEEGRKIVTEGLAGGIKHYDDSNQGIVKTRNKE